MTASNGRRGETRLLLATIAVSVGMLLLLARFRFPEEVRRETAQPGPAPLERLAAQATYDELAAVMADLERRIMPSLFAVGAQGTDGVRHLPAVRVTPDRAVALLPSDRRLIAVDSTTAAPILRRDPATDLVVIQTSPRLESVVTFSSAAARPGPRYVAVVEAMGGMIAVRPVYIGRADLVSDPRWSDQLMSIAAVQQTLTSGSAVFSLDGTFLGLATDAGGRMAIVRAATLRDAAGGTVDVAPTARGDLPLDVQALTPALARAARADAGVMVNRVGDSALIEGEIAAGDVVRSIDGKEVTNLAGYQQLAQSRTPGSKVVVQLVRKGKPMSATVTAIVANGTASAPSGNLGMSLRTVQDVGAEVVAVDPEGAAMRAGLRQGDVIVTLDYVEDPTAHDIQRSFRSAEPGTQLLVTVQRDGTHRVVALEKR